MTSIEDGSFEGCSSLASVTISTSTTTISEHAFAGCGALAAVIIRSSTADNNASGVDAEGASWGATMIPYDPLHPTSIARAWAPDQIIKQLAGPFAAYVFAVIAVIVP